MRNTFASAALILASTVVIFACVEGNAKACAPPSHRETEIAPRSGGSLPASAPGILVAAEEGVVVELLDASNAPVAGSIKTQAYRRYFAPTAPLTPGAYTVRYPSFTPGGPGTPPTTHLAPITVTPAAAVPQVTGALSLLTTAREKRSVTTSSGSCVEDADASMVRLAFTADPSLAPYQDVFVWETKVDGHFWAQAMGRIEPSERVRTVLNLYTACDVGTKGRDDGVQPGIHDITLQPILVGSAVTIPPAKIRVTVSCDTTNGEVHTATVPPVDPPTGGTGDGTDGKPTPTPTPTTRTETPASADDGGCAAAPGRHTSAGFASLIALGLVVARRRRR